LRRNRAALFATEYVLVNGQVVLDGGKHTGVTAGRALWSKGD
jgi:hypothetical protein